MTSRGIYADIECERRLRRIRRQARIEREERVRRLVYPVRRAFEYLIVGMTVYVVLWLLAFWASC